MFNQKVIGAVTLLVLGWAGAGQSNVSPQETVLKAQWQTPPPGILPAAAPKPPAASAGRAVGQITWINPSGRMLEVKTAFLAEPTRFFVDREARIGESRYPLSLGDLVIGEQIEIRYATQGERKIARAIVKR